MTDAGSARPPVVGAVEPAISLRLMGRLAMVTVLAAVALPGVAEGSGQYLTAADLLSLDAGEPDAVVEYGSDPNQFGHLRVPEGPGPHPVVVIIHGGCWLSFADLEHTGPLAEDLTEHGVATWSLEYRRIDSPGGGWPGTFLDIGAGIDHLRSLQEDHPLDLDRVVVVGHSAGGHLALWAAGREKVSSDSALHVPDPLPIHGVVSLAGPGDLSAFREADERVCGVDVIDRMMGGPPEDVPERYAAGSPARLLPLGVPQRMLTGASDPAVPPDFAAAYAEAAREAGDDASAEVIEDASHFEPVVPSTSAWPEVRGTILDLLPEGPASIEPSLRLSEPVEHLTVVAVREPMVLEHPTGSLFVAGYTQAIEESGRPPKLFRSDDDGSSWARVDVGTPEEGAVGNSDVDLAVGPDGTLYFLTMGFDRTTREGTHVAVGVSHDVGESWTWSTLTEDRLSDRPWIGVAPDGTAHVIWNDGRGVRYATSGDRGVSWSEHERIHPEGLSSHLAVGPAGELAVRITPVSASGNRYHEGTDLLAVSTDGGQTWTERKLPGERQWSENPFAPGTLPRWVEPVAWDAAGSLYSLWSEGSDLWLARSDDTGRTWESWRLLSTPGPKFYPYLVARKPGELAATWFSGMRDQLHANVARIDVGAAADHLRLRHETFRPDTWAVTEEGAAVRDTAGEYLPVVFLDDGDLGLVTPIQNAPEGRLGFAWYRIRVPADTVTPTIPERGPFMDGPGGGKRTGSWSSSASKSEGEGKPKRGRRPLADSKGAAKAGIGFGTALAIAISWSTHGSILWAIIHGLLSWFYVIYYALFYR